MFTTNKLHIIKTENSPSSFSYCLYNIPEGVAILKRSDVVFCRTYAVKIYWQQTMKTPMYSVTQNYVKIIILKDSYGNILHKTVCDSNLSSNETRW